MFNGSGNTKAIPSLFCKSDIRQIDCGATLQLCLRLLHPISSEETTMCRTTVKLFMCTLMTLFAGHSAMASGTVDRETLRRTLKKGMSAGHPIAIAPPVDGRLYRYKCTNGRVITARYHLNRGAEGEADVTVRGRLYTMVAEPSASGQWFIGAKTKGGTHRLIWWVKGAQGTLIQRSTGTGAKPVQEKTLAMCREA
jgi:membrane-bound inhibitor of C-type lysozyme